MGPAGILLLSLIGIAGIAAAIMYVLLPKLLPQLGIDGYRPPFLPEPSAEVTMLPVVTMAPMDLYDPVERQTEVVFPDSGSYSWFADPYFYDNVMLLSAGKVVDQQAVMLAMYFYYPDGRTAEKLPYSPQNDHFLFPRFNDDWIVYLDAKMSGGGAIMAIDRSVPNAEPVLVKDIYSGQPEIGLWKDYIVFTDRTGTNMDKLFVCDLSTMETVTLAMFQKSIYGQSTPDINNGIITWADADIGSTETSAINTITIGTSGIKSYSPGTYVHDVENDGLHTVWLTGHHGPDTALYYSTNNGPAIKVADGVVDFGLSNAFIAYTADEVLYAYMFNTGKAYQISPDQQRAQFLGVSDGKVLWLDVTSRDVSRDVVMFAEIP